MRFVANIMSADAFLGVPYNITSYAFLTHLLAAMTGRYAKSLKMRFGDFHLYDVHVAEDNVLEKLRSSFDNGTVYDLPTFYMDEAVKTRLAAGDFSEASMDGWAHNEHFGLIDYRCGPFIKARMVE